jgi:hypothetical protein
VARRRRLQRFPPSSTWRSWCRSWSAC